MSKLPVTCPCCGEKFTWMSGFASHVDRISDPKILCRTHVCWCGEKLCHEDLMNHLASIEDLESHYILGTLGTVNERR